MKEVLTEITRHLAHGDLKTAKERLNKLRLSKLTREETLHLAGLARQAGNPELAIRLLGPRVHPKGGKPISASDAEKATYAGSLIKIGAIEEALDILKGVDLKKAPEGLLFKGHAAMFQWDYSSAIPHFTQFLGSDGLSQSQRTFVKLNLSACYISERRLADAELLLEGLRNETEKQPNKTLYGNVLELSAQCAFFQKNWKEARAYLSKAEKVLADDDTMAAFFIKKWSLLLELSESKKPAESVKKIAALRKEALRLKHWESVRDCDFWKAIKTQDTDLIQHVYFGTPYEAYRKRIFLQYPKELKISETFDWNVEEPGRPAKKVIDLFETGKGKPSPFGLRTLTYKLLVILLGDFYRPFRLGVLHAKLYPNDYFNPDTSPVKVYQTIKVLRKVFADHKMPLDVIDTDDGYRLSASKGFSIRMPKLANEEGGDNELDALKKAIGDAGFSAPDVEKALGISRSSVHRLIKRGMEQGSLEKSGHGYSVQYQFKKSA